MAVPVALAPKKYRMVGWKLTREWPTKFVSYDLCSFEGSCRNIKSFHVRSIQINYTGGVFVIFSLSLFLSFSLYLYLYLMWYGKWIKAWIISFVGGAWISIIQDPLCPRNPLNKQKNKEKGKGEIELHDEILPFEKRKGLAVSSLLFSCWKQKKNLIPWYIINKNM